MRGQDRCLQGWQGPRAPPWSAAPPRLSQCRHVLSDPKNKTSCAVSEVLPPTTAGEHPPVSGAHVPAHGPADPVGGPSAPATSEQQEGSDRVFSLCVPFTLTNGIASSEVFKIQDVGPGLHLSPCPLLRPSRSLSLGSRVHRVEPVPAPRLLLGAEDPAPSSRHSDTSPEGCTRRRL